MATVASGFLSLACLHDVASARVHALGCIVVSSLKIMHFSPCFGWRWVNHRLIEQAPGDDTSSQRPLLRADGFAFNTNRRGFKTGSNGQEEHAGLALLDRDGPDSQARRHSRPVGASVQTRNLTKRRTALSNQTHNMSHHHGEQGPRRDARAPQKSCRLAWHQGKKKSRPPSRETEQVDSEGNCF